MREGTFENDDGLELHYRTWRPDEQPRAVVAIVHGFKSHSGYYTWTGEQLCEAGLAVYAVDLRGHGESEGERYYIEEMAEYLRDVAGLLDLIHEQEGELPIFLLGHCAGGVIACLFALERQEELAGLISESFAHQGLATRIVLGTIRLLSRFIPHTHLLGVYNEHFSRHPAALSAMNSDSRISGDAQPTRTIAEMARASKHLARRFDRITLPLLILHGTGDKVSTAKGSQHFYDEAGSEDKTIKLYEGHAHDLLNDMDRELVMKDIVHWLHDRMEEPKAEARSRAAG